jgi:hypothetical protein
MDDRRTRKFGMAIRTPSILIAVCLLLLAPAIWKIRRSQLARQERTRAMAALKAVQAQAAQAEETRENRERQAAQAAAAERIRQLYQEIDQLTRLNDRLLSEIKRPARKRGGPG